MTRTFRIVTRKSKLALVQANAAKVAMQKANPEAKFEIIEVLSDGCYDRFKGDISSQGGKGIFIKGLEQMILAGEADIAVHSMKDVPTDEALPEGLTIPAMLPREDNRDVVICRRGEDFVALKPSSKVGTSSPRRAAQIKAGFPDLEVVKYRGNVDTRLQKLDAGEVDAILLARAGLKRLGLTDRITVVLEPDMMCPAVGQGAVGIECRTDDTEALEMLAKANHQETFKKVMIERHMLEVLQGDCHSPIGGYCEQLENGNFTLTAMVSSPDGSNILRSRHEVGPASADMLGEAVARDLISQGAEKIIKEAKEKAI